MNITMRVGITGTRNGEDWPPVGGTINLPADEAAALVEAGLAVPADKNAPAVEAAAVEAPEAATTPKPRARKAAAPKD